MFNLQTSKVQLAERRVVVDATRCRGGVSHTSHKVAEDRNGEMVVTETNSKRIVDHEKAVARCDQARRRVISAIKKYAKSTPVGWVVPETSVGALENDLQDAYAACHDANQYAESVGSERRVHPAIVYAQMDWSDPSISRLVFETLADRVEEQVTFARELPVDRLSEVRAELLLISQMVSGPCRATLELAAREIPAIARDRREGREPDLSILAAAVEWFR